MDERRKDMLDIHETLKEQNLLLKQILEFMCPVSAFCHNMKIVTKFGGWLAGLVLAGVGLWQAVELFFPKHK